MDKSAKDLVLTWPTCSLEPNLRHVEMNAGASCSVDIRVRRRGVHNTANLSRVFTPLDVYTVSKDVVEQDKVQIVQYFDQYPAISVAVKCGEEVK